METIAVYGSGTIGSCQATLIIGHGLPCVVIGHSEQGLERCRKAIARNWDDLIAEGLATDQNKEAALKLLTVTNDPAALAGCTFVFEAVAEGTEQKQAVVLNRSVPGFLVNRFAQALFRESIYLIEQGVTTAADIDKAVKYAMGMRYASIGLLEYFDAVKAWTMPE